MTWIFALATTLIAGWFLARALGAGQWNGTRWTGLLGAAAMAVLFGPGLASIFFFALVTTGHSASGPVTAMLVTMLVTSAGLWWKVRATATHSPVTPRKFPWTWALMVALSTCLALIFLDFSAASQSNPSGEWDASAIWNLRARYLASANTGNPNIWRRAISEELGGVMIGSMHPGYPLFLSSFIALLWTMAGDFTTAIPVTVSLVVSLALVGLLVAGVASRRSVALGLLAGLVLLATELFASQMAAQYSDLLQGLAFLAAIILLDAATEATTPQLLASAGLAIGLAPWIKNEGLVFGVAALAVAAWRFRGAAKWVLLGAAPGLLATVALKSLAQGREAMFPATIGEALAKLADISRWIQALLGFGKAFMSAGSWWSHPILLVAALAFVLRLIPREERSPRFLWAIPILAVMTAEYVLFLITTADLGWHISTSVERLVAQVWPSLLWLAFSILRTPEEYFPLPDETAASAQTRSRVEPNRRDAKRARR